MSKQNRWRVLWGCAVSKNFFDVAHAHSKASNKNSAMAVSGGLSYSPSHRGHEDFDTPPSYWLLRELNNGSVSIVEMYTLQSFRLTVLGLAKEQPDDKDRSVWVCKCSCGMFCLRTARKLRKKKWQACGVCQQNRSRIQEQHHAKTGVYLDDAVVWQRMGGA